MPNFRTLNRSFAGGEVTPEFYGQIADAKFQTGVALARNFTILPHGPAANRAGTRFVKAVKYSNKRTRLIPFQFSRTQTFVIEMGDGYFRFHTMGGTLQLSGTPTAWSNVTNYTLGNLVSRLGVNYYAIAASLNQQPPNATYWYPLPADTTYEIPSPYLESEVFDIHFVQSSDVLTLVHPNHDVMELRRYGATDWRLETVNFASTLSSPTNVTDAVVTGTGTTTYKYVVTAVDSTGLDESLPSSSALLTPALSISAITQANPGVFTTATHNYAVDDKVYISNVGGMTQLTTGYYLINTVPTGTTFTIKTLGGVPVNTTSFSAYTSGGLVQLEGVKNNLLTSGNSNRISWSTVANAVRYNVYKQDNGLYGFIGQTDALTFIDNNITADLSKTPPIQNLPFAGPDNDPQGVSYYEQRRFFAGTNNKPQNFWGTRSGTESSLSFSIPTRDDDAISYRVAAREANKILHIVPLNGLLMLTSSAEWLVTSLNTDAITPTSVSIKPQSYIGSNNAQPVIVNNNLIFAAAQGGHLRELAYNWQAGGYLTGDLSLRAPHLFDTFEIIDMTYAKAPQQMVYSTSSNGTLIGLTYVPEQQVGALHWHDSYTKFGQSYFKSVCAVTEGNDDALYAVVQRVIEGVIVQYVERFASRMFDEQADAYFVDCGVTYDNPFAITGITQANPGVVTTSAPHGFSNGDPIDINKVQGMVEVNGNRYYAAGVTSNTFQLQDENGNNINTTGFGLYFSDGLARKAISTITSGLDHLEGETVSILADGAVFPRQEVTAGMISLENPSSRIHIGLPITADLQTLPVALEIQGFGQGRVKNINEVWMRVYKSGGIFAGPSFDKLKEVKQRTTEPYGTPPRLKSTEVNLKVDPLWDVGGQLCIRQEDPLPLTLVSMTMEIAVGG